MDNSQLIRGYDLAGATGEILIMLLIMFMLGAFLGWLVAQNARTTRKSARAPQAPLSLMAPGASDPVPPIAMPSHHHAAIIPANNLQVIVGIGPKVEESLNAHGIHTLEDLSKVTVARLEGALRDSGNRVPHNVFAWPEQARLILDEQRRNTVA